MKRTFFVLLVFYATLFSSAQSPVIRATLRPSKGIVVGQAIHLNVTVLVPNYFTGSPDFPVLELEDTIVVQPQDRPQNLNETIGGVRYAGISQSYTIYPQQEGEFHLPSAQFMVPYASTPPKTTEAHLSLPRLTFRADIPEAARGLSYFLPTTRLTLQQRWGSPIKSARVGDTLHRTITITTVRTQGMFIPPVALEGTDGTRIYPEQAKVLDQKTKNGEFIYGQRTQSARYFLRKEGDYTLPAIHLQWWNLNTSKLVTSTLPPVHLIVAPNPGYVDELPPAQEPVAVVPSQPLNFWRRYSRWIRVFAPIFVLILLLLWPVRKYVPTLYLLLNEGIERRESSERSYFRHLIRACKRNDAQQAYIALINWRARFEGGISVRDYLHRLNDDALTAAVDELGGALYSNQHKRNWSGKKLSLLLELHRHRRKRFQHTEDGLPQLNP
jgi:hypothetical protein